MTKEAVSTEYENLLDRFSDEMIDVVGDEFGGGIRGRVAKTGAKAAFKKVKSDMQTQGDIVVEYADAVAHDRPTSQLERRFLETNPVYKRYSGPDEAELERHLLGHFNQVGKDLAPLILSDRNDFWAALADEYSQAEAEQLIERHFSQAETFKKYQGDIFRSGKIATKVINIVERGGNRLRHELQNDIQRAYAQSQESTPR